MRPEIADALAQDWAIRAAVQRERERCARKLAQTRNALKEAADAAST